MTTPLPLGTYLHYKGNTYEVLTTGRDATTCKEVVIYKALYDSPEFGDQAVWIRDLEEFQEYVEFNGERIKRFTYVEDK